MAMRALMRNLFKAFISVSKSIWYDKILCDDGRLNLTRFHEVDDKQLFDFLFYYTRFYSILFYSTHFNSIQLSLISLSLIRFNLI
jgi:hypothetical protein